VNSLLQQIWGIITLPYEAFMNADAIAGRYGEFGSPKEFIAMGSFTIVSAYKTIPVHFKRMWIITCRSG
jgi:hypothetical protein